MSFFCCTKVFARSLQQPQTPLVRVAHTLSTHMKSFPSEICQNTSADTTECRAWIMDHWHAIRPAGPECCPGCHFSALETNSAINGELATSNRCGWGRLTTSGSELASTTRHGALRMSQSKRGAPVKQNWLALQRSRGGESKRSGDPGQATSSRPIDPVRPTSWPNCFARILMSQRRPQNDHALVFWVHFCVSSPHDGIWVYCPVPQLGFAMVDCDAGVGQQFLLHRGVHRGHAIRGRAPHVDVIQEREEPFFRPQSSLDCKQRIVLAKNKCRQKSVSLAFPSL